MDGAKLKIGFGASEDVCASVVGFAVAGACPNDVLIGPEFDDCVGGTALPKMLPGLVDGAGFCPNGLLEGSKVDVGCVNSVFEEESALAGRPNGFVACCDVFVGCPNNDVCGLGSSGFGAPEPKRLPCLAAG